MKKYVEPNVEIDVLLLTDVVLDSLGNGGDGGYIEEPFPGIYD